MLTDTAKMIAYRAETAMVALLRRHLNKDDDFAKTLMSRIHRCENDFSLA